MQQAFDFEGTREKTPAAPDAKWLRFENVQKTDGHGYAHLVRGPDDPERSGAKLEQGRKWEGHKLLRKIRRGAPEDFTDSILSLLSDGTPRTFNRIAVELLDVTADIVFETPFDRALERLFESGRLEMSAGDAPIFWRITSDDSTGAASLSTPTQGEGRNGTGKGGENTVTHDDRLAYQAFVAGSCEGASCTVRLEEETRTVSLEAIDPDAASYDRLDMIRIVVKIQWERQRRHQARFSESEFLRRLTQILSEDLTGEELSAELAELL